MELLANDLSVHGQFPNVPSFHEAIERLMAMRSTARRFERDVYCNRSFLTSNPIPNVSMPQAIGQLPSESRQRSVMVWLTHGGPFWDDFRQHGDDDWLECDGEIVTKRAVGEAAYRSLHGVATGLVSVTPSEWDYSPVRVTWKQEADGFDNRDVAVDNWTDAAELEPGLRAAAPPIRSWDRLHEAAMARFQFLVFADNCFEPLGGTPFSRSSVDRFLALLEVLDRLAQAFDATGKRTPEGHRIYQDYFTGDRAWFSDSSDSEKSKYEKDLTFPHPTDAGSSLFCTMHGKVRHLTLRLHYWWSQQAGDPVFVVYAGPKITKR